MKDLSEVSRHTPMPSDIEDTTTDDKKILEGLPLPEAGLKPLNYREQFSVRLTLLSLLQAFDSVLPPP